VTADKPRSYCRGAAKAGSGLTERHAADAGTPAEVLVVHSKEEDLMSEKHHDLTLAMEALRERNLTKLEGLLGSGRIEVNQPYEGKFLLVEAVQAGKEFVQALLEAGAKPNVQDKRESTALVRAASRGNVPALKALLDAGADPDQMPNTVTCPLVAAAGRRSAKNLEAVQALLAAGANVSVVFHSDDGVATGTVLIDACAAGNVEAVRALLAAGADPNVVVLFGTALTRAAEGGFDEVVRVLLEAGADPSLRVPDRPDCVPKLAGKTALEIAREKRRARVVALLAPPSQPCGAARSDDCRAAWQRLEAALNTKHPDVVRTFEPGATLEDLRALEAVIDNGCRARRSFSFEFITARRKNRHRP
jgi:ankyrin repeat protein